ncbi:MAG TPA: methionine--tRNA ligase [Flavilitoribacter sp.]|nr:methionine--tRNA ligase [Flavilitoribacter sp.]HMQ86844.1 methionine--tRNA ligase [Flavilitoribacter sp.]
MNPPKRYIITSALPYANGALHLGHLAGAYLPADIYVRFLRLQDKDVVWVCGSDEHGAAITIRAKKEGISPRAIIDKYHELNKDTFERLGISFDYYHRTSAPLHHETSQDFFLKLLEKGDEFEVKSSDQLYDEDYDQFLADRYIKGTCPNCGFEEAFGDQCERCGTDLSPTELINPVSMLSGKKPVLKATQHWYFRLDKHEAWLREWIATGQLDGAQHHDPSTWRKHVVGQCLSWLDNGLQSRSITRDLDWGISVPLPEAKGKVLYVWFDAPIGYISSTKQWALENGKNWEDYWKSPDSQLIHFIGKDNIVFHCIIFPAMLHAYGNYNLPVNVPANQFLNFEGQKFSKSRGWGIEQHEYLEEFRDFPNKEDALRYALLRNLPENKDSDFKWDEFVDFHDKELADNLGNFINRVIVLTQKYYDGIVPSLELDWKEPFIEIKGIIKKLTAELEAFNFKQASQYLMELSAYGNTYLQDVSPWQIVKEDPDSEKVKECMLFCLQVVACLSILSEPFIPFTSPRIRKLLNLPPVQRGDWNNLLNALEAGDLLAPAGHRIGEPEVLFPKIQDRKDDSRAKIIQRQKDKLDAIMDAEKGPEREPFKPEIQYDDFAKLDLRTGTILEAEKVQKADKLLKLTVDLGSEKRTIVSGIALQFEPASLVGKKIVVVANLAPRQLRGITSQGMILLAENEEGKMAFVSAEGDFGNGWGVK